MLGAVHWALLVFAADASVLWLAYAAAVVNARSVVVAVLWAELKAAVGIGVAGVALALPVVARSVVGALVRAGLDFASNASPSAAAEAGSVVAHATSGAVTRAGFGGTVGAHPALVAVAGQVHGANAVSAALLWAGSAAAVFAGVVIVALADTLVASSVVVALVRAGFSAAGASGEPGVAHALSPFADTVAAALVRAARQWARALCWAGFFGAVVAFVSFRAFAALVLSALAVAAAPVGADLHGAALAGVPGIALAGAVLHAAPVEVAHFGAFRGGAVHAGEHFRARAGTFVLVAHAVLGLLVAVVLAGLSLAPGAGEFLAMEGWGGFDEVADARVVDAHTVAVTVVRAILFGAVAATEAGVALALSVAHATAVEAALLVTGGDAAVRAGEAFLALAVTFDAGSVGGALVGAGLGGAVISSPHLALEGRDGLSHGVALALAALNVALAVFHVADAAQLSFVAFVALALAFFAVSVVPAVVGARLVLAAFSGPVGVAQAGAVDARPLFLSFVAVHRAFLVLAVRAFVQFEAFRGAVVHDKAVAWDNVAGVAGRALVAAVALAFDIEGSFLGGKALAVPAAGGVWLADRGRAVGVAPALGAEAGPVEATAVAGLAQAVLGAHDEVAVFPAEPGVADAGSVTVAGSVLGAVVRAEFEATVAVGEALVARADPGGGALSVVGAHVRAGLHGAVQAAEAFGALADALDALPSAGAVVWAGLDGAVGADEWVLADALEVRAGPMAGAVLRADHRLAGDALPALAADTGPVVAVPVLGAGVGAQTDAAVGAAPSRVTEALVRFLGTTDAVAGAVVLTDHDGAVGALPAWHALAAALLANAVTGADGVVLHWAGRHFAGLPGPVTVARALSVVLALSLPGAVLRAAGVRAVDAPPARVAGAVPFAAGSVVAAVLRAGAVAAVLAGEPGVAVARSVEALPLHGAPVEAGAHGAVAGRPAVFAAALPAHAVPVPAAVVRAALGDVFLRKRPAVGGNLVLLVVHLVHNLRRSPGLTLWDHGVRRRRQAYRSRHRE